MNVLILGARAPAALEWSRAFTSYGWRVYAADSLLAPITRSSASVRKYFRLPEPKTYPDAWISSIINIVKNQKINLILPTCEEVFYLSWGQDLIRAACPQCEIFTSDFSLLNKTHHKGHFSLLTKGWKVEVPETHILENIEQIKTLISNPAEWVLKPAYSRFATQTLIKPNEKELQSIKATSQYPWVGQRFIYGKEYCSFSVLNKGKVTAHACYHPSYRVGRGSGIYFEVENPPDILQFVQQFGADTKYTGQVGFDFIQDANDKFFVLECNPRATSGIHLFGDNPDDIVEAVINTHHQKMVHPSKDSRMLTLAMLSLSAPKLLSRKTFWQDFQKARDVIGRRNDLAPILFQGLSLIEVLIRAFMRRTSLLSGATADIEWDGHDIH